MVGVLACAGILGKAIADATRRGSAAWLVPAVVVLIALLTVTTSPGSPTNPAAATSGGVNLVLGRSGLGLLAAAAMAIAFTLVLAPIRDGGELLVACVVGAASTAVLSATVPLIWGLAAAVAAGALAVRWIAVAPGPATLAAGRIGGVGAGCLLGAAAFIPPAGGVYEPRAVLSGAVLAVGMCCLLGLVPFGGWAAGTAGHVRGADFAPWGLLFAPAMLVSAMDLAPQLVPGGEIPFNNTLLVFGLVTMIVSGVAAARARDDARYARLLIADLAFAAAGVGTTHPQGRTGAFIIVLTHLCIGPLLLNSSRAGLHAQRSLAWLSVSGVPPTPAFWGRYLVLIGCTATAPAAMAAGLTGGTVLFLVALEGTVRAHRHADARAGEPTPTRLQRGAAWAVAGVAIVIGLAPAVAAHGVFGI